LLLLFVDLISLPLNNSEITAQIMKAILAVSKPEVIPEDLEEPQEMREARSKMLAERRKSFLKESLASESAPPGDSNSLAFLHKPISATRSSPIPQDVLDSFVKPRSTTGGLPAFGKSMKPSLPDRSSYNAERHPFSDLPDFEEAPDSSTSEEDGDDEDDEENPFA